MEATVETTETTDLLRDQLSRLSVEALKSFLINFNYQIADDVEKADLVDAVATLHENMVQASVETNKKAVETSEDPSDPIVEMEFANLESPGAPVEFTWQPPKGEFKIRNGKALPAPKWHFYPGKKYNVPLSVVNHLNSLQNPADKQVSTDNDGFISSLYSGDEKQKRFSCNVIFTAEQIKRLKETA